MSILHKLMPTRSEKKPVKVIADFDDLISEPIGFRFQGRDFEVKPVDAKTFMKIAKALDQIQILLEKKSQGEEVTDEQVYEAYLLFIEPLCPEMTIKLMRSMTLSQIHALVNLIIRHVTGQTEEPQKKN